MHIFLFTTSSSHKSKILSCASKACGKQLNRKPRREGSRIRACFATHDGVDTRTIETFGIALEALEARRRYHLLHPPLQRRRCHASHGSRPALLSPASCCTQLAGRSPRRLSVTKKRTGERGRCSLSPCSSSCYTFKLRFRREAL